MPESAQHLLGFDPLRPTTREECDLSVFLAFSYLCTFRGSTGVVWSEDGFLTAELPFLRALAEGFEQQWGEEVLQALEHLISERSLETTLVVLTLGFHLAEHEEGEMFQERTHRLARNEGVSTGQIETCRTAAGHLSLFTPTAEEKSLFANSAVSYDFWTDSIESEDRGQLRLAVSDVKELTAKKPIWEIRARVTALIAVVLLIVTFVHGNKDVGMHTGDKYIQVFGLLALTCIFGMYSRYAFSRRNNCIRFLKHPVSQRLRANSEERFNIWLTDLETTDPDHHAEIVDWFRRVEQARQQEEARIERERQASIASWQIVLSSTPAASDWQRNFDPKPMPEFHHDYEPDRRRQAAFDTSRNANQTGQTGRQCHMPDCTNPGEFRFHGDNCCCGIHIGAISGLW
jgi:hypothetical protein